MDRWLLTYIGLGYLVALSLFGPAVFSAVLKDLAAEGKIGRLVRDVLLVAQFIFSLVAIAFVVGFVVRSGKLQGHSEAYRWAMTITGLVAMALVITSLAYLNKKLGNKPWGLTK
jgi:uncharacterized membrane protein